MRITAIYDVIGPMHEEKYHLPRFGFHFESGNPPSENQYFSTFQIPLEPR